MLLPLLIDNVQYIRLSLIIWYYRHSNQEELLSRGIINGDCLYGEVDAHTLSLLGTEPINSYDITNAKQLADDSMSYIIT